MIKKYFQDLFNNKIDAIGLSVFRMCYCVVLFFEILHLFKFQHLIFDDVPFNYIGEINVGYIFFFWIITLLFLFHGLFTRTATILNYLFSVIIFASTSYFEYHVFYAYVGVNFFMIFMPVSRVLSLDSLIEKIKYTNIGRPYYPDRKVLELNYLVPVFAVIALVYFDSIFYKFTSRMWTSGLGMWTPSSLPMMVWNDTSAILNNEILVKSLGYLVMVFESVFIFLFWFRRFRVPFLLLGLFFHFGILVAYPIPWFALAVFVAYFLMIPPGFWRGIADGIKSKRIAYKFYYDAECPLCNKVIVAIRHFDIFKRIECLTVQGHAENDPALKGIPEMDLLINIYGVDNQNHIYIGYNAYIALLKKMIYTYPLALLLGLPGISHLGRRIYQYIAGHRLTERCTSENCLMPEFSQPVSETEDFLVKGWNRLAISKKFWKIAMVVLIIMQFFLIGLSPLVQNQIRDTAIGKGFVAVNNVVGQPQKKFLGVTTHPVFMYNIHFEGYNHIFKFVCNTNNKRVPLLDDNGMVTSSYANGALWVNYTFRTSSPHLHQPTFENGALRYLRQFEHENGLKSSDYTIYVKEIETTDQWQKDFLHKQIAKPWQPAGTIKLTPQSSQFEWNDKMKAVFASELR